MPFIFLLLFALVYFQQDWRWKLFDWPTPAGCAILVGSMIALSWLSAWMIARVLAWQMTRHPEQRVSVLRRYGRMRRFHFIALLTAYLTALYVLGWGNVLFNFWREWVPSSLQSTDNLPGFQIGLLAPFFLALIAAWERFHRVEKTAYETGHPGDRFLPKWAYLLMQVRHQFFLVLPPVLLMLALQILHAFVGEGDEASLIMIGIMALALVMMPLLLRFFLGLKPLPPGPLRDRLEGTAERLGFRYSNVLVWDTRHLMANALVTGFVPWIRYVVLTDRVIDELTPEEIEAVFGHEVGHVKCHHLFFYLVFFLTSFILLSFFWNQFESYARQTKFKEWVVAPANPENESETESATWNTLRTLRSFGKLGLLAGYTFLFFGFISRRCERQADLFGSHTVSTDVFVSALEKVAYLNGIARDRAGNWLLSWQHPTIAQRVDFLRAMHDHPERVPQFHRSIFLLKGSFFLALGFLVCWFGVTRVWELLKDF